MSRDIPGRVNSAIEDAIARGEFSDLPGAGKPLPAHLESTDNPDWWLDSFLERERINTSDLVDPVFILRRQAENMPATLDAMTSEAAVREQLATYNRAVKEDRLRLTASPVPRPVAPLINVNDAVAAWRKRAAERVGFGSAGVAPADASAAPPAESTTWLHRLRRAVCPRSHL